MDSEKFCNKCKTTKLVSDFNKNKTTKDGFDYECKACYYARKKSEKANRRPLTEEQIKARLDKFWSKIDKSGDCWLWKGAVNSKGYGSYAYMGVHCFAWESFNGPIQNKLWVLHKCDNPRCCNPSHLFLGTQIDNMQDCVSKRRNIRPKLNEEKVYELRRLWETGVYSQQKLGDMFGVNQRMVSTIVRRETWRHVE